jgi:hypothetical protein
MSEEQNTEETGSIETPMTEIDTLKQRARTMGIAIPGNIGITSLKNKIEARLSGSPVTDEDDDEVEETKPRKKSAKDEPKKTKSQIEQELRDSLYKTAMRLRRVQIYCLNPAKNDLMGEIISVGNRYIGTVKKLIPYGEATDGGYHIEQVLYDDLKSRKFQQLRFKKSVDGSRIPESRWVPEYNIVDMPDLTKDELDELKLAQQAAERVNQD